MSRTRGAGWELAGGNRDVGLHFVHLPSLQQEGPLVTAWMLGNNVAPQRDPSGFVYLSSIWQQQFDCAGRRFRIGAVQHFAARGGQGAARSHPAPFSDWSAVAPGSVAETNLLLACRGAGEARGRPAAPNAAQAGSPAGRASTLPPRAPATAGPAKDPL